MKTFFRIIDDKLFGIPHDTLGFSVSEPSFIPDEYLDNEKFLVMRTCHGLGDWVILSACKTALGGENDQNTFAGLVKAFFYAGTQSLLVSHWDVETNSAYFITTNIFEKLSKENLLNRSESLQKAKLELLKIKGHPYFWSPFVLVGDGSKRL